MAAKGALISLLGDSITTYEGFNPAFYPVYYEQDVLLATGVLDVEDTWWAQVLDELDAELLVNNSWSGSRVSGSAFPAGCSPERTHSLHRGELKPEQILIYMGLNDFGMGVTPHSENEDDLFTFYGAYTAMLRQLKDAYLGAELCCGTLLRSYLQGAEDWVFPERYSGGYDFEEYNRVIRAVCATEGARLCELAPAGERYETLDSSHPTLRGHKEMAELWLRALEK